jgi:hypothetical protein
MLPIVGALLSAVSVSVPFWIGTEVSLLLNVTRDCKLGAILWWKKQLLVMFLNSTSAAYRLYEDGDEEM